MNPSQLDHLRSLIRARYALIHLVTGEESRALQEVRRIAAALKFTVVTWSSCSGLMLDGKVLNERTTDLRMAIDACEEKAKSKEPLLFVFLDAQPFLTSSANPVYRRRLKEFALNIRDGLYRANCIILGSSTEFSGDIIKEITIVDFPVPGRELVRSWLDKYIEAHRANPRVTIDVSQDTAEQLVEASLGLTLTEIENSLSRALVEDHRLDASDIGSLLKEKQQVIRKSGILDYIDVTKFDLSRVGGLENLKRWLDFRRLAFQKDAQAFGVRTPKGVLLTGVPGCGKSLTAKCIASSWKLPLLKLDMGKVFQGLVGSSEANIREALASAEAMSPCVLWIDEIEKGLSGAAGGNGDGGTATRVFGTLLTWMQEKTAPVFVVATANDVTGLPPELLRKGRFDELFFVDLPTFEERKSILGVQLAEVGRFGEAFDLDRLATLAGEATYGAEVRLSGAEIDAWVSDALLEAYRRKSAGVADADLQMSDLEKTVNRIVPIAKMRKTEISQLRAWASANAVSASDKDERDPLPASATGGRVLEF